MRERTNANGAGDTGEARGCGREEELMSYLYGESSHAESADFRRHLADCAACGEELAAFGGVRAGLGEWREEVMRSVPALNVAERVAPAASNAAYVAKNETRVSDVAHFATPTRADTRTRSASAALREFFSLAPTWLRFGTATAAVLFCALAVFTLARVEVRWDSNGFAFNTGVRERVVEKQIQSPAPEGFTQEQVDALVRRSVEREVAAAQDRWKAEDAARSNVVNAGAVRLVSPAQNARGASEAKSQQSQRRPNRGSNNQLLAEDNGDDFYPGEESVPRLTDILGAVKTPVKNEQ